MSDVTAVTKYFATANEGFIATITSGTTSGAATIPLSTVAGLTDGSVFVGIIEPGVTLKQQVFTGTVNTAGSSITGVVYTRGSNTTHASGVTVVDYTSGTLINMLSTGILKQHKQTGVHSAITADSLSVSGSTALTSLSVNGVAITGRNVPTIFTTTSASSITPTTTTDSMLVTALAANLTINNVVGTPTDGQTLTFRFKDNGTIRTLTWGTQYRAVGVTIPGATVASKMLYVLTKWNTADSKYDVLSVAREA